MTEPKDNPATPKLVASMRALATVARQLAPVSAKIRAGRGHAKPDVKRRWEAVLELVESGGEDLLPDLQIPDPPRPRGAPKGPSPRTRSDDDLVKRYLRAKVDQPEKEDEVREVLVKELMKDQGITRRSAMRRLSAALNRAPTLPK